MRFISLFLAAALFIPVYVCAADKGASVKNNSNKVEKGNFKDPALYA